MPDVQTHLHYTKMALAAGKHVLVEKPVGCTVREIEEMVAAADASPSKLHLVPGHNYIHEAPVSPPSPAPPSLPNCMHVQSHAHARARAHSRVCAPPPPPSPPRRSSA